MKFSDDFSHATPTEQDRTDAPTGTSSSLVHREAETSETSETSEIPESTENDETSCHRAVASGLCDAVFKHPEWPRTIPDRQPKTPNGQSSDWQFTLARVVKEVELDHGRQATPLEQRTISDHWYESARKHLRPEITPDDCLTEYLDRYGKALKPIGHSALETAWANSKTAPPVIELRGVYPDNSKVMTLAKVLRELAREVSPAPFYLSSRNAGKLLDISPVAAAKQIRAIEALGIIKLVAPGNLSKSPRYEWVPQLPAAAPRPEPSPLSARPRSSDGARPRESKKAVRPPADPECFNALARLHGAADQITNPTRGAIWKALKVIGEVCPHVTAEEIERRAGNYKTHYSGKMTAPALAKHWATCDKPAVKTVPAWRRIRDLQDLIADHPANPESRSHSSDRVTDDQRRDLKRLRAELSAAENQDRRSSISQLEGSDE